MKANTKHILVFVCLLFCACQGHILSPVPDTQNVTSSKVIFEDSYPNVVSDVMLDSLYDFYFWLHHRDVTDRAIARFQNQLAHLQPKSETEKLEILRGHRRLAVAYMMAWDEVNCARHTEKMLKFADELSLNNEEKAKILATKAYRYYWFDVTNKQGLMNIERADSLMRQQFGIIDLRSVQMSFLKSLYLLELGKKEKATESLDSAFVLLKKLPVTYPSVEAWAHLMRVLTVNSNIDGDLNKAEAYFNNKRWENHPIMGIVYSQEGLAHYLGNKEHYEAANRNFKKTLHPGHLKILNSYENLIEYNQEVDKLEKSLVYLDLLLKEPKANKAIAYGLAAKIHAALNHPKMVDICTQKAIEYVAKTQMPLNIEGLVYDHLNFANVLLKHPDKCIFWSLKALSCYEKSLGFYSKEYNGSANSLARFYGISKHDFHKGLDYAYKALKSIGYDEKDKNLEKVLSTRRLQINSIELCGILAEKFRIFRDSDSYDKAENAIGFMYRIQEKNNQITRGGALNDYFSGQIREINDWAISRNLTSKRLEKAFYHSERFKLTQLRGGNNFNPAMSNIPKDIFEHESQLRTEIVNLQKYYNEYKEKDDGQEQIAKKQTELNKLLKKIEREYPNYYKLMYNAEPTTLANIQSEALDDETALISYFVGETSIYVFTVLKNDLKAEIIQKPLDFDKQIETFRAYITKANPEQEATIFTQRSAALYDLLLRGVLEKISPSITKLIIVPDDILSYIPFDILAKTDTSLERTDFRQTDFLLNHYQISYAYSAHHLIEQKQTKHSDNDLLFAGFAPKYQSKDTLKVVSDETRSALCREGVYELKGANDEVKTISNLVDGKAFTAESATEGTFKREANHYRILHFAMHSLTNDKEPLFSKLLFTVNPQDTSQDNDLTAGELYAMNLNADLAVLSACNTGYGKISSGEGVMSLARAFTYAGVPATITSLWKIPDLATREIMVDFYKNLKLGMTKDAALRQAKLTYLKNAPESIAANPYFWAGFVPIGNMIPMDLTENHPLNVWWIISAFFVIGSLGLWLGYKKKR